MKCIVELLHNFEQMSILEVRRTGREQENFDEQLYLEGRPPGDINSVLHEFFTSASRMQRSGIRIKKKYLNFYIIT